MTCVMPSAWACATNCPSARSGSITDTTPTAALAKMPAPSTSALASRFSCLPSPRNGGLQPPPNPTAISNRRSLMTRCTYLLPIRRTTFSASETAELTDYFRALNDAGCAVLIIDGSPAQVFQQHHEAWLSLSRHEKVDRSFGYLNDKVNGIHTGVNLAATEKIILADDDIRYAPAQIERVCDLLD